MSWYEWLLFLHVLGAFAMVGATVFYWCLLLVQLREQRAGRIAAVGGITRPADIAVGAGSVMTLVFGIWLAIYLDAYQVWDGWVLAALVLWAIFAETGRRSGIEFVAARDRVRALPPDATVDWRADTRRGQALHAISSVVVLLLLADMLWKPGA